MHNVKMLKKATFKTSNAKLLLKDEVRQPVTHVNENKNRIGIKCRHTHWSFCVYRFAVR